MWFASVEVGLKHTMYGITLAQLGHLANLLFMKLLKVYSIHFNNTVKRQDGTKIDDE